MIWDTCQNLMVVKLQFFYGSHTLHASMGWMKHFYLAWLNNFNVLLSLQISCIFCIFGACLGYSLLKFMSLWCVYHVCSFDFLKGKNLFHFKLLVVFWAIYWGGVSVIHDLALSSCIFLSVIMSCVCIFPILHMFWWVLLSVSRNMIPFVNL